MNNTFIYILIYIYISPFLCAPNTHSSRLFLHVFRESASSYCARALLLCAQALLHRILQETRSADACAVQTRVRPVHFSTFFTKV